jgi:glycine cleavage system transcriptional repressor
VRELAITAVGRDRPGIVAGLTAALLPIGANLHDCRAALLRGSFAMVMAVEVPDSVDVAAVRAAMAPTADELGLEIWVGDAAVDGPAEAGERCVVSVYGADHPGIVHATSAALAALQVNILDLSSRVVGDPPVYVLGIEAALPPGLSVGAVEAALGPVAATQQVELHVEREADEVL